jgi:hypothetical protein
MAAMMRTTDQDSVNSGFPDTERFVRHAFVVTIRRRRRRFADGPFGRRRLFLLDWPGLIFSCLGSGLLGLHVMEWVDYLRDEAAKYRRLAEQTDDPVIKDEMLELASVCEEVANNIEDRLTGG